MKIKAEFVVLILAALAGIMLVFRGRGRGEGLLEGAPYAFALPFQTSTGNFDFSRGGGSTGGTVAPSGCYRKDGDALTEIPCPGAQQPAAPATCYRMNADGSQTSFPCPGTTDLSTVSPGPAVTGTGTTMTTTTTATQPAVFSNSGSMLSSTAVSYLPTQECTIKRARTSQMINAQGQMQEVITGYDEFRSDSPQCQPCPVPGQVRINGVCTGSVEYNPNQTPTLPGQYGQQITGTFSGRDNPWTPLVEGPEDQCTTPECIAGLVNPGSDVRFSYGGQISSIYQAGQTAAGQNDFEKNQAVQIAMNAINAATGNKARTLVGATYSRPNNSEEVWTVVYALSDGCTQAVKVRRVWKLAASLAYSATGQPVTTQSTVWGPWAPTVQPRICTSNKMNPAVNPAVKPAAGARCGDGPAGAWSRKSDNGDCVSKIDVDDAENGTLKKFLDLATKDIDGDVLDNAVLAEIVMVRTPANKVKYHFLFISEADAAVQSTLARFALAKPATVFFDKAAYNKWVVVHATVDNGNVGAPRVTSVATPQNDLGTSAGSKCAAGETKVGSTCTPARQIKPDSRCPAESGKVKKVNGCECPPGQKDVNGKCAWTVSGITPTRCVVSAEGKKYPYYRPRRGQPCVPCNAKNGCNAKKFA